MALKGDYAQLLAGLPIPVKNANIAVTQPKIVDICAYGENKFYTAIGLFTKMDFFVKPVKDGNPRLQYLQDFQVFMTIVEGDKGVQQIIKDLFDIIFPQYVWKLDYGCIQFSVGQNQPYIGQLNPMNIDNFVDVLNTLFFPYGTAEEKFNPVNDRAKEIAEKLQKGRQKRNELKQKKEGEGAMSLFATQISSLEVGLGMNINEMFQLTPFQLFDCYSRYIAKMAYDFYQRVETMPFMDTTNSTVPDNWLDNLYK